MPKSEPLIRRHEIRDRLSEIGSDLNTKYAGKKPIFVGVLNGAYKTMSTLMDYVDIFCHIEFIRVQSYEGTESSGTFKNVIGLPKDIGDRPIILVEDIVDTGNTLHYLVHNLLYEHDVVETVTLLDKPSGREVDIHPDRVGFTIEDTFVVGYGLDYKGYRRNLPHIYELQS